MASTSTSTTNQNFLNITIDFTKITDTIIEPLSKFDSNGNEMTFVDFLKSFFKLQKIPEKMRIESSLRDYIELRRLRFFRNKGLIQMGRDLESCLVLIRLKKLSKWREDARFLARIVFDTIVSIIFLKDILPINKRLASISKEDLFFTTNAWRDATWNLFMEILYKFEMYMDFGGVHKNALQNIQTTFLNSLKKSYNENTTKNFPILLALETSIKCFSVYQLTLSIEMARAGVEQWQSREPGRRHPRLFCWLWPEFRGNYDSPTIRKSGRKLTTTLKRELVEEDAKHLHSFPNTICQNAYTPAELVRESFSQDTENINVKNYDSDLGELHCSMLILSLEISKLESMLGDSSFRQVENHQSIISRVVEVRKRENSLVVIYEKCVNSYTKIEETRQRTNKQYYTDKFTAHLKIDNTAVLVDKDQVIPRQGVTKKVLNKKNGKVIGSDMMENLFFVMMKKTVSLLERSRQITSIPYFVKFLQQHPPKLYSRIDTDFRTA